MDNLDSIVNNSLEDGGLDTNSSINYMVDKYSGIRGYLRRLTHAIKLSGLLTIPIIPIIYGCTKPTEPNNPPVVEIIQPDDNATADTLLAIIYRIIDADKNDKLSAGLFYHPQSNSALLDTIAHNIAVESGVQKSYNWNTSAIPEGTYIWIIRGYDKENVGEARRTITIEHAPVDTEGPVTTLNPYTGAPNDSTLTLTGTSTDNMSLITKIEYSVDDGGPWTEVDAFTPSQTLENYTFTTDVLSHGPHTIAVRGTDEHNNVGQPPYASQTVILDLIAPSAIDDLVATTGDSLGTVDLTFTARGDDADEGIATEYDGRYSVYLTTMNDWNSATKIEGEPIPTSAGNSEHIRVVLPTLAELYFFAVEIEDDALNKSGRSNTASAVSRGYTVRDEITDLFSGDVLPNTIVTIGTKKDTTDSDGLFEIMFPDTGSLDVTIDKEGYNQRETNVLVGGSDGGAVYVIPKWNLVDGGFPMDHYNKVARKEGETKRWETTLPTNLYINTSAAIGSGIMPSRAMIDTAKYIFKNKLPQLTDEFFSRNPIIEEGDNPPYGNPSYTIICWDDTQNSGHAELIIGNEIVSAEVNLRTSATYGEALQELSQTTGLRDDSNLVIPSVFNSPGGINDYVLVDLHMGKFLYSRPSGNKSPDITLKLFLYRTIYNLQHHHN